MERYIAKHGCPRIAGRTRECRAIMSKENATEFRKQAAACLEVAKRMSLDTDRKQMLDLAEHRLELARQGEKADGSDQT